MTCILFSECDVQDDGSTHFSGRVQIACVVLSVESVRDGAFSLSS